MQDDADAEDLEDDFLGARLDPFALLENMAGNNQSLNTRPGIQPYEILANQARRARQKVQPKGKPQQKRKADELHGSSEEVGSLSPPTVSIQHPATALVISRQA